ncbi:MAG: alpha/beta fold hydrolase [Spirochaetia bacterium]
MTHRTRIGLLACIALFCAAALFGKTGDMLAVSLVEALSPSNIDMLMPELFTDVPAPAARYTVDSYLMRLESTYLDGKPTPVTVQVFVPRFSGREKRILYVFAPGSTGLRDACRPSREHIAGIHWGLYRTHVLSHVGQGVIGVLPDYMGFGDPDPAHLQPYMSVVAEGRVMLDAIRAVREFLSRKYSQNVSGTAVFVAGFSQGGHAAFAAADLRARYAPKVRIDGIIGYGPSTDVEALFREFPEVAPMAIYTFSRIYGRDRFDPDRILAPKWAATLEKDVTRQCVGGMQSYYPASPRDLFRAEFAESLLRGTLREKYPEVEKILRENSPGLSGHRVPALILEGSDDVVVSVKSQEAFVRALCRTACPVKYSLYKGRRHDTRQIGFKEARAWMERRALGESPETSCGSFK